MLSNDFIGEMAMKIKAWMVTLIVAIIITINTIYLYISQPEDTNLIIFSLIGAICFYIATFASWRLHP